MTINLKDIGSFHIGGRQIKIDSENVRDVRFAKNGIPVQLDVNGTHQVEQMYVQYYIPEKVKGEFPLVLLHGGSMTGVVYETTPDGREGWLNYFLKKDWAIYNTDSVERGRSGWSPMSKFFFQKPIVLPKKDPFERYRIGKGKGSYSDEKNKRVALKNTQFPVEDYDQFVKQLVPRWINTDEIIIEGFIKLIKKIGPCVLIAHSQGGTFAQVIAGNLPNLIKGLVLIEPSKKGGENEIKSLIDIPILVIYGDYILQDERWQKIYDESVVYFKSILEKGGDITIFELSKKGIKGNSHMMMMDKNNIQIAEIIQEWLTKKALYN